ncbi:MAG: hypothetical protein WCS99_12465 [Limisphaerales bacterium]
MEFLFEILFSVFGELLLQLLFEVLVDIGFGALAGRAEAAKRNPVVAFFGYILLGAIAGGLSLLLLRNHLLKAMWLRLTTLVVVPVVAGWMMSFIGSRREAKGKERTRMESFANGWAFALAMGMVRFFFAR